MKDDAFFTHERYHTYTNMHVSHTFNIILYKYMHLLFKFRSKIDNVHKWVHRTLLSCSHYRYD